MMGFLHIKQFEMLYSIFSAYSEHKRFGGCPCCIESSQIERIANTKLRNLSADDLSNYVESVFYTVGTINDFKYYLQRILEICMNDQFDWPDPEIVLKKLSLADWTNWPEKEFTPVKNIIQHHFSEIIRKEKYNEDDVDTWLFAISYTGMDIDPFVTELIDSCPDEKFTALIIQNANLFTKGKLCNAFWEEIKPIKAKVVSLLDCERSREIMTSKYGMIF